MALITMDLQVSFRRGAKPCLTALAYTCAVLSFVMPHRWVDRIADAAVAVIARFGLRVTVTPTAKKG